MSKLEEVRKVAKALVEEHGSEGTRIIDALQSLEQEDLCPFLMPEGESKGEEARWGSRDWIVYSVEQTGELIGVQYYNGATENQEDMFEGTIEVLEQYTQTVTRFRVAETKETSND